MQPGGFDEEQAAYSQDAPDDLVGQFRRFGDVGPAYEVIRIFGDGGARIRVVYSGEELSYPIKEIVQDPIAETVP